MALSRSWRTRLRADCIRGVNADCHAARESIGSAPLGQAAQGVAASPGDWIPIAREDGSVVRFRVEGLERWPKAAFPTRRVFGDTHTATLRLVTCSGNFDPSTGHYVDKTIMYAARPRVRQPRRRQ
jgi:hypothetical protein